MTRKNGLGLLVGNQKHKSEDEKTKKQKKTLIYFYIKYEYFLTKQKKTFKNLPFYSRKKSVITLKRLMGL